MPWLRSTMRRAREGLPPTMPRTDSISSLPTGVLGRKAEVPVMKTAPLLCMRFNEVICGPGRLLQLGFERCHAAFENGRKQPLYQQAQRNDGDDERHQIDGENQQHRAPAPLSPLPEGADQFRPDLEGTEAGA